MDLRQFFVVAVAVSVGALLAPFFKYAQFNMEDHEGFMEAEPEREYNHVDSSLVDYYTSNLEEILPKISTILDIDNMKPRSMTSAEEKTDWKEMAEIIRAQNMKFKASRSQFYCKANPVLFFPTVPEPSFTFFEKQKYNKQVAIFNDWDKQEGAIILRQLPPNEDPKEYVDRLMQKSKSPPSEFHGPKATWIRGQIDSSIISASMNDIKKASQPQKSPNLVDATFKSPADNKDEPDLSLETCYGTGKSVSNSKDPQSDDESEQCSSQTDNIKSITKLVELVPVESVEEEKLKTLIATFGAVVSNISIGGDGSRLNKLFKSYGGGIFDYCSMDDSVASDATHEVAIVGYGITQRTKYWEVRNTWGANWGENGLFRIKRGVNCNRIEENVSVPVAKVFARPLETPKESIKPEYVFSLCLLIFVSICALFLYCLFKFANVNQ